MDYDLEFTIEKVMSRYENFSIQRRPLNIKCKCHICGDSRRDPTQARLNSYYYNNVLFMNCYNCGYSASAYVYLRDFHQFEYTSYKERKNREKLDKILQKEREENEIGYKVESLEDMIPDVKDDVVEEVSKNGTVYPKELPFCHNINDIVEEHPVVQYIINRKIPREKWHRLFFTVEFKKLANYTVPNTYSYENKEPRLIIPIYNEEGYIESYQGRSMDKRSRAKYVTMKFDEEATKIYGLDTVDKTKMAFFLEGQIDSLFIDNGLAITGGNISISELNEVYPHPRAFILDNENRHPDTIQRIDSLIKQGENIVLFDRVNWKGKDINEFVINGVDPKDINEYIKNNVVNGIEAKVRFAKWKKVDEWVVKVERGKMLRENNRRKLYDSIRDRLAKNR